MLPRYATCSIVGAGDFIGSATARKFFGIPTFFVGEEMYFGKNTPPHTISVIPGRRSEPGMTQSPYSEAHCARCPCSP